MPKILITGANGQLGSELAAGLRALYGTENVITSDITKNRNRSEGPHEYLDVMDSNSFREMIEKHSIDQIYHLAAILSANAEKNIHFGWDLNVNGLLNTLKLCHSHKIDKLFWPSSIAVFGPDAVKQQTPQNSPCNPTTVYGISKVTGEQWCAYYHRKFGVDVRSVRYPGLIGYKTLPGGGTTDYAVDIYHKAVAGETFSCILGPESALPMMYMSDAVKATIDLMSAPSETLSVRTSYNISGMSFTPSEIAESIQRRVPEFSIEYEPDYRQEIASSWPDSIDDSEARADWNWKPEYDLDKMTHEILDHLPGTLEELTF